jgi:Arc/MetJ family transcription regulator
MTDAFPPVDDDATAIRAWLTDRPEDDYHDTLRDLVERADRAAEAGAEAAAWYRRRLRTIRQGIEAAVREREEARKAWATERGLPEPVEATTGEAPE